MINKKALFITILIGISSGFSNCGKNEESKIDFIQVTFQYENATDSTIKFHIWDLGAFNELAIELKPGEKSSSPSYLGSKEITETIDNCCQGFVARALNFEPLLIQFNDTSCVEEEQTGLQKSRITTGWR